MSNEDEISSAAPHQPNEVPVIVDKPRQGKRPWQVSLATLFVLLTVAAVIARLAAAASPFAIEYLAVISGIGLMFALPGIVRGVWRFYRQKGPDVGRPSGLMDELLTGLVASYAAALAAYIAGISAVVMVGGLYMLVDSEPSEAALMILSILLCGVSLAVYVIGLRVL